MGRSVKLHKRQLAAVTTKPSVEVPWRCGRMCTALEVAGCLFSHVMALGFVPLRESSCLKAST